MKSIGGAGLGTIVGAVFIWFGVFNSISAESERVNIRLTIVDPFSVEEEEGVRKNKDRGGNGNSQGHDIRHFKESYLREKPPAEAPASDTVADKGRDEELWEGRITREVSVDIVSYLN